MSAATSGSDKSTRVTRSSRQRAAEPYSLRPRGETDRKKKGVERVALSSKQPQFPILVPKSSMPVVQDVNNSLQISIRNEIQNSDPREINEDIVMQNASIHPELIVRPAARSAIKPVIKQVEPVPAISHPPVSKPYVELPKVTPKPRKTSASESIKKIKTRPSAEEPISVVARTPRKLRFEEWEQQLEPEIDIPPPKWLKKSRDQYIEEKENVPAGKKQYTESTILKQGGRKSELSAKIEDSTIVDKILKAQIPVKIEELESTSSIISLRYV
jgi:hypothetical protein